MLVLLLPAKIKKSIEILLYVILKLFCMFIVLVLDMKLLYRFESQGGDTDRKILLRQQRR
jgi:hypothetical protein